MSTYFSGQGKVYGAVRSAGGVPGGFVDLGNCSSLILHMGSAFVTNASGGVETLAAGVRNGDMPHFTLSMEDMSMVNMATLLYGQNNSITGTAVVSEAVTCLAGTSTPLANINLTTFTSLKNSTDSVTYALNTDYTVDLPSGMLTFPATSTVTSSCHANYTFATHSKVGAGTMAPPFLWLRFQGLNTGNTYESVVVDLYKVRLYPLGDLPLISDALIQIPVDGRMFKDTNLANTLTDGQFMRVRKV